MPAPHAEEDPVHEDDPTRTGNGAVPVLTRGVAEKVFAFREREHPLGFRHLRELEQLDGRLLDFLRAHFTDAIFGSWSTFPHPIPRRGPGSYDGVVHAALLHAGKVLFITADETTLLWDPANPAASSFEDPVNQPHTMPGGYSQLCGHHVFLSDAAVDPRLPLGRAPTADWTGHGRRVEQHVDRALRPAITVQGPATDDLLRAVPRPSRAEIHDRIPGRERDRKGRPGPADGRHPPDRHRATRDRDALRARSRQPDTPRPDGTTRRASHSLAPQGYYMMFAITNQGVPSIATWIYLH